MNITVITYLRETYDHSTGLDSSEMDISYFDDFREISVDEKISNIADYLSIFYYEDILSCDYSSKHEFTFLVDGLPMDKHHPYNHIIDKAKKRGRELGEMQVINYRNEAIRQEQERNSTLAVNDKSQRHEEYLKLKKEFGDE